MEGAPENIHTDELLSVIRNTEGVKSVHDLHVWTITSNIHVLSCHIVVDGNMTGWQSLNKLPIASNMNWRITTSGIVRFRLKANSIRIKMKFCVLRKYTNIITINHIQAV